MNWIIRNSKKISYHTNLDEILRPFLEHINNYNWILSDIEGGDWTGLPIDYEHDYFVLSPNEFQRILNNYVQFYWGIIIGVPISVEIMINENNLPYAEGNRVIWENGNLQCPNAEIEIICFDSSYTIIKFTNEYLSNKFKDYFEADAIPLQKFTSKYIK
jgi:hypothetical protein